MMPARVCWLLPELPAQHAMQHLASCPRAFVYPPNRSPAGNMLLLLRAEMCLQQQQQQHPDQAGASWLCNIYGTSIRCTLGMKGSL